MQCRSQGGGWMKAPRKKKGEGIENMVAEENNREEASVGCTSRWVLNPVRCVPVFKSLSSSSPSSSSPTPTMERKDSSATKPGGWRVMPYILGNETFERLATMGILANFMVYLLRKYNMSQVTASNILNIWGGITNFAPLIGAFISDAYAGRFLTIAVASFFSFLGMLTLTLTAGLPHLRPPPCTTAQQQQPCHGPTSLQLMVLLIGLGFLSVGTGGIRPCSIPFGVDQFEQTTEKGQKEISSFYNWYYMSFTVVLLIALTLIVYIQDSVSWVWGFGVPTVLMFCSILVFFAGTRVYIRIKPEGSTLTGIAQVFVAAYRKRRVTTLDDAVFYDPPAGPTVLLKLPLTDKFRFLNKAALVTNDSEQNTAGSPANRWNLCSIQQVEEAKCILKIVPIWSAGILAFTAMVQQGTFTISQALKMDRHLGRSFQIPAGSLVVISMITIGIWLPIYDRFLVPSLRRVTKQEGGITLLQRIGIGMVFSIGSMVVAGFIERYRRSVALLHPNALGLKPMWVMWLAPQLVLMGLCEAFTAIGMIEFFNRQFPDHMRSIGNSLFFCLFGASSYVSSLVVTVVHGMTGGKGRPDWLANDINAGKLDHFYFLLGGMGVLNLVYFLYCARRYDYKSTVGLPEKKTHFDDVELAGGAATRV